VSESLAGRTLIMSGGTTAGAEEDLAPDIFLDSL
jgi:hypothetical protein